MELFAKELIPKRVEILKEPPPKKISKISSCLNEIKLSWKDNHNGIAGLWQDWTKVIKEPLASNCRPISYRRGILVIGASHPEWLQALQYNKVQLIARLRASGNEIKDIRIQRYHNKPSYKNLESESNLWRNHPSRVDVHGTKNCEKCNRPSPAGEINLWKMCGFCRREDLSR